MNALSIGDQVALVFNTVLNELSRGSEDEASKFSSMQNQEDAPPCSTCGSIMVRSGACYKCANCGTTSGCA